MRTTAVAPLAPLKKILAVGLAYMVSVGLLAVVLVLALPFPYAIAFGGLACFVAGVPLSLRVRSGAVFALGLVALFAFVGAASEAQIWLRARLGLELALDSVDRAPLNMRADKLTFPDATARLDLVGEARSRLTYSSSSIPSERSAYAVPLVPPGWKKDDLVSAWLVCDEIRSTSSEAGSCASQFPARLQQAWPSTPRPEAAQAAMVRHDLTAVADPAWLSASDDFAAEQTAAGWMVLAWPGLAWLAWVVGVVVWRVVPAARPKR